MRNKTGIKLLTIVITLLSLFQLHFTWVSRNIEDDAIAYATDEKDVYDFRKKQAYEDSIWNKPVYNFLGLEFTYKEIKEKELNLGLDLKGGMHVTLEVSPVEIITALSGNNQDKDFKQAMKLANERLANSQSNFTTLFFDAFSELAPEKKLADIFANSANKGRIDFNTSDDEVKRVVNLEVDGAIDRAFEIIRTRIDKFGVSQPNIQRIQGTGRIQIELPGVDNPARVRRLLQGVAKLEFFEVYSQNEFMPFILKANDLIVKKNKAAEGLIDATDSEAADETKDELLADTEDKDQGEDEELFEGDSATKDSTNVADEAAKNQSDLFKLIQPVGALAYNAVDTSKINRIIFDPEVQALFPNDLQFFWAAKTIKDQDKKDTGVLRLHALRKGRGGKAPLTGDVVTDARLAYDQTGLPSVSMSMNVKGAQKWKKLTGKNVGKQIAIVLDGYVYSAPNVQSEISGGHSSITGDFSVDEAKDLANVLKAGKLPAPTRIVEEAVVGPSLGLEAQFQGVVSAVAGLVLVIIFMVAYYSKGGMVANIALIINIFFIIGVLANLSAALTLPGIAGIVLTIGMSIDANVLIFERIREELRMDPQNLMKAIDQGYDKAFWTIFDSNITTLLTGIFLSVFGSGPVKGFAVVLIIGILCSFFSAVFITRVIVFTLTKKGNKSNISFVTPFSRKLLSDMNFSFLAKRKMAYITSAIIITLGISTIIYQGGLNLGVDFQGGRSYVVEFTHDVSPTKMEVAISKGLDKAGLEVKSFGSSKKVKVTTNYLMNNEEAEADDKVLAAVVGAIESFSGDKYEPNMDGLKEGKFTIPSTAKVGATIADDIADASRTAGVFSLIAIFFYIWMRFRRWRLGLGAIVALFHDVLVVFSAFALARLVGISYEVDQVFVAAILTVIGYSINDTVVVFDRVREYLTTGGKKSLSDTLDSAINGTLNRTVVTSLTTLFVVLVLFIFGGEVLRGFSFALLVGLLVGTYSSIFIATPVFYDATNIKENKENKENKEKPALA